MCLTLDALVAFLSRLPINIIETEVGCITLHAERQDAAWVAEGDVWCVNRPEIDLVRLETENRLTPRGCARTSRFLGGRRHRYAPSS